MKPLFVLLANIAILTLSIHNEAVNCTPRSAVRDVRAARRAVLGLPATPRRVLMSKQFRSKGLSLEQQRLTVRIYFRAQRYCAGATLWRSLAAPSSRYQQRQPSRQPRPGISQVFHRDGGGGGAGEQVRLG